MDDPLLLITTLTMQLFWLKCIWFPGFCMNLVIQNGYSAYIHQLGVLMLCLWLKQVGKVSMEWVVGDKTKVAGTFPPRKRGWTGYVEKDTAGQTNIYSVEVSCFRMSNLLGFYLHFFFFTTRNIMPN